MTLKPIGYFRKHDISPPQAFILEVIWNVPFQAWSA